MKAELIKRLIHLQEQKLDLCLEFNEQVSQLFVKYVKDLSSEFKQEFIDIAQVFIDRYNELLGEEGETNEEEG